MLIVYLFVFSFGLVVGSFLNVVILRLNSGWGVGGRSRCFTCSNQLSWLELLPVLSFVGLGGRCKNCKARISIQYPLVELATGFLFLFFFLREFSQNSFSFLLVASLITSWAIWCWLLVIFVYDLRHQIIPNAFVYGFLGLSLVSAVFEFGNLPLDLTFLVHRLLAALVLFLFFFSLWSISGGRWIGFGDAKLAIGIGLYLGLAGGLSAVAFAFWIGAGVSLAILAIQKIGRMVQKNRLSLGSKTLTMKSAIPFAPFLILGTFLSLALGSDIFGLHQIFF
jgi:leader peptidase (prepilin peptidase)/N-methyltransferase